jgi:hypothetical protein
MPGGRLVRCLIKNSSVGETGLRMVMLGDGSGSSGVCAVEGPCTESSVFLTSRILCGASMITMTLHSAGIFSVDWEVRTPVGAI